MQAQLTDLAKPRRLSSTSQGVLVHSPQTGPAAHCLRVTPGEQGSALPPCWKINQQSLLIESFVLTIKQLRVNA